MNKNENLNGILLAALCLIAGLISPSNGVDSSLAIPKEELINRVMVIGASAILIFIVLKLMQQFKSTSKK